MNETCLVVGEQEVWGFNLETGDVRFNIATGGRALALLPDASGNTSNGSILVADGTKNIMVLSWRTALEKISCENKTGAVTGSYRWIAAGMESGELLVWCSRTGLRLLSCRAHHGPLTNLGFTTDEKMLLTTGKDGMVRAWDTSFFGQKGQACFREWAVHTQEITGLHLGLGVCDRMQFAVSSRDGKCSLHSCLSETPLAILSFPAALTAVAMDSLERVVAAGGEGGEIFLFFTEQRALCDNVLSSTKAEITGLLFSIDNTKLVAVSQDGNVSVWSFLAQELLFSLSRPGKLYGCVLGSFVPTTRKRLLPKGPSLGV